MKVTFDLPDWAMDGFLQVVMNHMELVAYKEPGRDSIWMIKTDRCNRCAECCLSVGLDWIWADDEGKCRFLQRNGDSYECNAGAMRPVKCMDDPRIGKYIGCSIKHKAQNV